MEYSPETIRNIAQEMIKNVPVKTLDAIRQQVAIVATLPGVPVGFDTEALVRELEARFNVRIGSAIILEDHEEHIPWLPGRRGLLPWDFWNRYRYFLEMNKGFEPDVVRRLDELTDDVLSRLEDPTRAGAWSRRGMVTGQVQSGKTANYNGLICKALDAGYKLIVVLAGMHNSLRSQTQLRLDEAVVGFDTRRSQLFGRDGETHAIGVGALPAPRRLVLHTLTSSKESGDFKRTVADTIGVTLGSDPVILAVKKNGSVLRNLMAWARGVAGQRDDSQRMTIRQIPLLLIDDEADVASINTKIVPVDDDGATPDDYDVSKINESIRELLQLFEQHAYIGYTATPFANIFIHSDHETERLGRDLFPRHFIINLPAPSTYVGPAEVFGTGFDPDGDERVGIDIIRHVNDQDTWMPDRHTKYHVPQGIPPSLVEAIHAFLLSGAARTARGQGTQHKSMLVHVTRYTDVQRAVADMLRAELSTIRNRLEFGDGNSPDQLTDTLRDLWERDFVRVSATTGARAGAEVSWERVQSNLLHEAKKIEIKLINGTAQDALEYVDHAREGLSVICVGGDKLSRGLTLEGLTVSYYLRAARMYDTLMQMGRWFGYRPGYLDLCRLYTTPELEEWYRHITIATEELRGEFEAMAESGRTPVDFGLRVRTHPNGLMITAANKLRHGVEVDLSYDGDLSETIIFDSHPAILQSNLRALENLVLDLGGSVGTSPVDQRVRFRWQRVPGSRIVEFLWAFRTHEASDKVRAPLLAEYINEQIPYGELVEWTVVLMSKQDAKHRYQAGDISVGLTERSPFRNEDVSNRYRIRQLHSPRDEFIDLTPDEWDRAMELTAKARMADPDQPESRRQKPESIPDGVFGRQARDRRRGLMLVYLIEHKKAMEADPALPLVGLVFSFPSSDTAHPIKYRVNNVYWEQEYGQ
jgi:hypothetical protein